MRRLFSTRRALGMLKRSAARTEFRNMNPTPGLAGHVPDVFAKLRDFHSMHETDMRNLLETDRQSHQSLLYGSDLSDTRVGYAMHCASRICLFLKEKAIIIAAVTFSAYSGQLTQQYVGEAGS